MNILSRKAFLVCAILQIHLVIGSPITYRTKVGKEYLIYPDEKFNWYQAMIHCSQSDSQLVALNSQEKRQLLQGILAKDFPKNSSKKFWIGGKSSRAEVKAFRWLGTQEEYFYSQLEGNQANTDINVEQCAYIESGKAENWRSASCFDQKMGFICEGMEPEIKENHLFEVPSPTEDDLSNSLWPKDLETIANYTQSWKKAIRNFWRSAQINVVKVIFSIENIIAKFKENKEKEE